MCKLLLQFHIALKIIRKEIKITGLSIMLLTQDFLGFRAAGTFWMNEQYNSPRILISEQKIAIVKLCMEEISGNKKGKFLLNMDRENSVIELRNIEPIRPSIDFSDEIRHNN